MGPRVPNGVKSSQQHSLLHSGNPCMSRDLRKLQTAVSPPPGTATASWRAQANGNACSSCKPNERWWMLSHRPQPRKINIIACCRLTSVDSAGFKLENQSYASRQETAMSVVGRAFRPVLCTSDPTYARILPRDPDSYGAASASRCSRTSHGSRDTPHLLELCHILGTQVASPDPCITRACGAVRTVNDLAIAQT